VIEDCILEITFPEHIISKIEIYIFHIICMNVVLYSLVVVHHVE